MKDPVWRRGLVCVLLLIFTFVTGCQPDSTSDLSPASTNKEAELMDSALPDDLIRVGDSMVISLNGVPVESRGVYEVKVDEAGQISMPMIGNIQAAGDTTVALKEKIETLYRTKRIFRAPNVSIVTREDRYVSVTGDVRQPQRVVYTKDLTAMGAIAACGGFTDYADKRKVKILRQSQILFFDAIEAGNNPAKDIHIQPDDRIEVGRTIF